MNGRFEEWRNWDEWMRSRPQRTNRQARFFAGLDQQIPRWESFHFDPKFSVWLGEKNLFTGKSRLDLITICSKENYDANNTAHFYVLFKNRNTEAPSKIDVAASHRPGTLIGDRYEVIRSIGSGAFGSVYFVYSHELNQFEALKMTRTDASRSKDSVAAFKKEANVWTDIGLHPNVLRAHFVDYIDQQFCILMEYIAPDAFGRVTLRDWIGHSRVEPIDLCRFALNICDGMETAYSRGLKAHRDLKPENVLVDASGAAKISDFGIAGFSPARVAQLSDGHQKYPGINATAVGTIMGTPAYMAPEAIIDSSSIGQTADIYSFGIILYEMLSGGQWPYKLPRSIPSHASEFQRLILQAHLRASPRRLWHPLNGLVRECLAKDRRMRPQTFSEVRNAIARWATRKRIPYFPPPAAPDEDFWDRGQRASSLYRLGRYREALNIFESMMNEFGDDLTIFNIALCQTALDQIDEAIATYHRLLKRNETHVGGLVNLAGLLARQDRGTEAETLLHRALAVDATEPVARVNLGNLYFKAKDFKSASGQYEAALKYHPSDPTAWHNLALAAMEIGDQSRAREALYAFLDYASPDDSRIEFVQQKLKQLAIAK